MRALISTLLLVTLAGCSSHTTLVDFSFDDIDGGGFFVDDLSSGSSSCLQLLDCHRGCDGDPVCSGDCDSLATTNAERAYEALFTCAVHECEGAADGGAAACSSDTDTSDACSSCVVDTENGATCDAEHTTCVTAQ
jgi:hypothetical protein